MASTGLDTAIRWLAGLESGLGNLSPFMTAVARHVTDVSKNSFANQATPGGLGWKSLAPATVADRAAQGYGPTPILVRTGGLRDSVRYAVDLIGSSASVGSDLVYAGVHQFGNPAKPKITARPFLEVPVSSEAFIWKALERHLDLG